MTEDELDVPDGSLPDGAEGVVDDLTPEPNDLRRVAMDVATDDETVDIDRGYEPSA